MSSYRIIGYLKKESNWHVGASSSNKNLLETFFLNDEASFRYETFPRRVKENGQFVIKNATVISYAKLTKIPVVSARLIPAEGYQGSRGVDWYKFSIVDTDLEIYFSPKDITKILSELARDHRFYLTGDGSIRLTFTFRSAGGKLRCRLLKEDEKIINLEDK